LGHVSIEASDIASTEVAAGYLYGLGAGEFVAARDQLARSLRAAGRRDLAAGVKALRRPTVVAAQLNRALRAAPTGTERLLTAAGELRRGHQALVAGEAVDLAALRTNHRAAAREVADRAERDREAVEAILERVSLDDAQHAGLRAATFDREPEVAIGFELLGPLPPAAPSPPVDREEPTPQVPAGDDRHIGVREPAAEDAQAGGHRPELDRSSLARDRASSAHGEAVHASSLAQRRLEAAVKGEQRAAVRVQELEQRLVEARRHHDESGVRLDQAVAAVELADARVTEAADRLHQADAELARVSGEGPAPRPES
jgi:hypothetical protein